LKFLGQKLGIPEKFLKYTAIHSMTIGRCGGQGIDKNGKFAALDRIVDWKNNFAEMESQLLVD
jgi:hypothetical protein